MKKNDNANFELDCPHDRVKQEGGYVVCLDCGEVLEEEIAFNKDIIVDSDFQRDYERNIRRNDTKAKQDPHIKYKYDKIRMLERWFKDYESSFTEQKKTIELLKSYGIGMNIDDAKLAEIKRRYIKYNKNHRRTYQNMVIIFLAIVWMEIKDKTNVRIERYIEACNELGHKVNKKMLNNAMIKVKRAQKEENRIKKFKTEEQIEKEIKEKIKIVFQKDLNSLDNQKIGEFFEDRTQWEKLKIEMLLRLDKILKQISYAQIRNLNYKAFTAGLMYYIGQTLSNAKKMFTQSTIEETTNFSSTTIRNHFNNIRMLLK